MPLHNERRPACWTKNMETEVSREKNITSWVLMITQQKSLRETLHRDRNLVLSFPTNKKQEIKKKFSNCFWYFLLSQALTWVCTCFLINASGGGEGKVYPPPHPFYFKSNEKCNLNITSIEPMSKPLVVVLWETNWIVCVLCVGYMYVQEIAVSRDGKTVSLDTFKLTGL